MFVHVCACACVPCAHMLIYVHMCVRACAPMRVHVCTCTCMHACVCACVRACVHVRVHMCGCLCARLFVYVHMLVCACEHACVCLCVHVCVHVHVYVLVRTRVRVHACVHVLVCACGCRCARVRVLACMRARTCVCACMHVPIFRLPYPRRLRSCPGCSARVLPSCVTGLFLSASTQSLHQRWAHSGHLVDAAGGKCGPQRPAALALRDGRTTPVFPIRGPPAFALQPELMSAQLVPQRPARTP